jgi:two-component system sensor histidine kinase BaeS
MADRRLRGSLLLRLLAVSVIVSVLSVAAATYLAVRTTTRAIQQEQVQAQVADALVYDKLIGYAATHRDWTGAGDLVRSLAESTGQRIAVTDRDGVPLAESAAGVLPARASATLDPLNVDGSLAPAVPADRIDPRAAGPFQLSAADRTRLRGIADDVVACLRDPDPGPADAVPRETLPSPPAPIEATIVEEPSGRPRLQAPSGDLYADTACERGREALAEPTASERRALTGLADLVNACMTRQRMPKVALGLDGAWAVGSSLPELVPQPGPEVRAAYESCASGARREQLSGYVAPAALLFITAPGDPTPARVSLDLSPANQVRIAGVSALVLLVTIGATVLVGMRLVRPLHALTAAAGRMRDGDAGARVRVSGRDEIARLGAAFNAMSEQRQRVEELRRAMVGDIAHEMRTPVTNIRGWLEAADDGVVPLDAELVTSLLEEALLLQHVIADLQDLAAVDAGELRLHPQAVEAAELLHAVADAFSASADSGGVALAVRAEQVVVTVDPIRLRQAVGNLVTNAIRHTPPGGRVTIAGRTETGFLVVDVVDTGPGIPQEQQALVFERFWRAEKSRSRQTGGSGLGLSIVRKLAEAHGGTASVTSAPGAGATFTLRIPIGQA